MNPDPLTYRELLAMYRGKARVMFQLAANIQSTLCNVMGGKAKPSDFMPKGME